MAAVIAAERVKPSADNGDHVASKSVSTTGVGKIVQDFSLCSGCRQVPCMPHPEVRGPLCFRRACCRYAGLLLAHAKAEGYARWAEALTGSKQEGAQDASERRMIVRWGQRCPTRTAAAQRGPSYRCHRARGLRLAFEAADGHGAIEIGMGQGMRPSWTTLPARGGVGLTEASPLQDFVLLRCLASTCGRCPARHALTAA